MNIAKIWNNGVREEGRHIHANVWFSSKTGQSFMAKVKFHNGQYRLWVYPLMEGMSESPDKEKPILSAVPIRLLGCSSVRFEHNWRRQMEMMLLEVEEPAVA